jgi:hypothetical protein
MAITFASGLEKCVIYEKLSTQKVTSVFNGHRPFAQILASQNSKGKYESRKILGFVGKKKFLEIFEFLLLFISIFVYFECFILLWIFLIFLRVFIVFYIRVFN